MEHPSADKKMIVGWSCTFESGLCEQWKTKRDISKILVKNRQQISLKFDQKIRNSFLAQNISKKIMVKNW